MCSRGKFLHLRCRQEILIDKCDGVYPLYRSAAIPAGHNQPDWRAVVFVQWQPVHLRDQKGLGSLELLDCEDPIRTGTRGGGAGRIGIETGDYDSGRLRFGFAQLQEVGDGRAAPVSNADHSESGRACVTRAFHQMQASGPRAFP